MKPNEVVGRIRNNNLEDFVAELAAVAYAVALRHCGSKPWLDFELELWQALNEAASKRNAEA